MNLMEILFGRQPSSFDDGDWFDVNEIIPTRKRRTIETFGERLQRLRSEHDMTIQQLSARTTLSAQLIHLLERSQHEEDVDRFQWSSLASALGVPPERLRLTEVELEKLRKERMPTPTQ